MRLVQFVSPEGNRSVGIAEDSQRLLHIESADSVYALAIEAGRRQLSLEEVVAERPTRSVDYESVVAERRLLPPLDHPDPSRCYVTGTGLSHLGSAKTRDGMHSQNQNQDAPPLTDSMRLFEAGLQGGKPADGGISVQPEWFYKGNGSAVAAPEQPIHSPCFAEDGGEEAELVGLYVISESGEVMRLGFALGNEFSDHVMERQNYLYLAHSKLRPCSFGPELRVGPAPMDLAGEARIRRAGEVIWRKPFMTGEDNMSYTFANLEHHHFKYDIFRQPGDVHCHFFGTATLSYADGIQTQNGDIVEISANEFGRPLRNPLQVAEPAARRVSIREL